MQYQAHFRSPFGVITIAESHEKVCFLGFGSKSILDKRIEGIPVSETVFILKVKKIIDAFWQGEDMLHSIPISEQGTDFQQKVWHAFPQHGVTTYTTLAHNIHKPKAVRSVAGACACNPISLLRPCHRVVAKSGELAGYAWGIETKRQLLAFEKEMYNA